MIVTSNSTALQILRGLETGVRSKDLTVEWTRPPNLGPWMLGPGMGPTGMIEPISKAAKDAAAKIAAILAEAGGSVDSSGGSQASGSISTPHVGSNGDGSTGIRPGIRQYTTIVGGDGNDSLGGGRGQLKVDSGAGDDWVHTQKYSEIVAGDGNDWVYAEGGYSKVDAGTGDDYVYGNRYMQIDGGAGNDEIRAYDYATVDAGEGDDLVVTYGGSTIKGGAGNDILIATEKRSTLVSDGTNSYHLTFGGSDIDGGEGDDYLQTTDNSTVRGGTGNDTIRLIGGGSTVTFAKGDGQDAILSADDFALSIAGYTKDDVTVTAQGKALIVSFNGTDDAIMLNITSGHTAHLVFEDGSSLDITSTEKQEHLHYLYSRPDWSPEEPFWYF